jgi:hypothetical protein
LFTACANQNSPTSKPVTEGGGSVDGGGGGYLLSSSEQIEAVFGSEAVKLKAAVTQVFKDIELGFQGYDKKLKSHRTLSLMLGQKFYGDPTPIFEDI